MQARPVAPVLSTGFCCRAARRCAASRAPYRAGRCDRLRRGRSPGGSCCCPGRRRRGSWGPAMRRGTCGERSRRERRGEGRGRGSSVAFRCIVQKRCEWASSSLAPRPSMLEFPAMSTDYLQKILTAKVYDVAVESALEVAPTLSARLRNRVLLKREDQQSVFSFKLRGAYNKMAQLSDAQRARGVIAASAGNHAQGVALAAQRLSCQATIVMPVTTPHIKVAAVEARGAKVVLHGDSYSDAYAKAIEL